MKAHCKPLEEVSRVQAGMRTQVSAMLHQKRDSELRKILPLQARRLDWAAFRQRGASPAGASGARCSGEQLCSVALGLRDSHTHAFLYYIVLSPT